MTLVNFNFNSFSAFGSTGMLPMGTVHFELPSTSIFSGYNFGGYSSNPMTFQMPQMNFFQSNIFSSNFGLPQFTMPAMPSFNFNQAMFAVSPAPSMNFGTFGTNVRSNNGVQNPQTVTRSESPAIAQNEKVSNVRPTYSVNADTKVATDAVKIALAEVGVRENGETNNSAEVNKYRNGVANGNPWCASFVSYCYGQGQNRDNSKTFGFTESSQAIREKAQKDGFYASKNSNYVPKVGDLAVWRYADGKGHVGIISKVYENGTYDVVEGNCANQVQVVRRSKNSDSFHGFVRMNEWIKSKETIA